MQSPSLFTTSTTTNTTSQQQPDQSSMNHLPSLPATQDVNELVPEMVPLVVTRSGEMGYNGDTKRLLAEVGGLDALVRMTTIFYERFWQDKHLKQFLGNLHTPLSTHAKRIAMYIAEMMGSSGNPWTSDLQQREDMPCPIAGGRTVVVDSRQTAHFVAWNSVTREREDLGRRFKLDDCRVWMRLMFWAARESGLADHKPFFEYFQKWVGHFIPIYERSAAVFTRAEARWSADPQNLRTYLENGRMMRDVVGVPVSKAISQLPVEERGDSEWAYNGAVILRQR